MGGLSHTVSGNIASFRTPSKVPIESLKFHFLPKQASGTSSPENPIPIEGWTGLNGRRAGKNLFKFETGRTKREYLSNGSNLRAIYHTGIVSDGRKICISATPKDPESITNANINIGYCRNGITYTYATFITTTGVINVIAEMSAGDEITLNNTSESIWGIETRNLPRYDIQIEIAEEPTEFVAYSGEQIPITFPDGQTIYGGYVDPIAGEIVAEYELLEGLWGDWPNLSDQGDGTELRYKKFTNPVYGNSINNHHVDYCNIAKYSYSNNNGKVHYYIHASSYNCRVYLPSGYDTTQNVQVIGKLITPIHIPIPAQDLRAFLDHNNFWSDANDITEVTYPVTESKDILATRKKAMAFDHVHHKKVKWNQICKYGDFQNAKDYMATSGYGSLSVDNGVMTWTALKVPTQYYQTGFTHSKIYIEVPYNHKVLAMAKVKTSCSGANLQARLYGMVGSSGEANTYSYNTYISGNDWIDVKGFIRDRPENPPTGIDDTIIKRFKILLALANGGSYEGIIDIGSTLQAKNFMAFDLTQMFGLGNEPQTVAEFERICAINGIDLTTYQPYDEGSDRWLIVP